MGPLTSLLLAAAPPPLTQEDHIRINFQALVISVIFVGIVIAVVVLISRRAGKKRYAAHQARLAAEGKLDRSGALTDLASNPQTKFVDDAEPEYQGERRIGSVFGDNYRPYGEDGSGGVHDS